MGRYAHGLALGGDLLQAAELAVGQARAALGGRQPDLALVFVAGADAAEAGERALELSGARATLGCTADGVLAGRVGVQGSSAVSVWLGVMPGAALRTFHLEVLPIEGAAAVVGLPEHLPQDEAIVLLADPYSFPADGFVRQAATVLPGLPLVGALARGLTGPRSARMWVDGRTVTRGAVGLVLAGSGAQVVSSQGCRSVGPVMTVTEVDGEVVTRLAGRPARDKVREVMADVHPADQALASQRLYLGVAAEEQADEQDFLAYEVLGTDKESGGLVLGEHISVGQTVRVQVRDADAAHEDLRMALKRLNSPPGCGALVFSDRGRGAGLFGPSYGGDSHDASVVQEMLAAEAVAGMFSEGEIGPVGARSHLNGLTASVLVLP